MARIGLKRYDIFGISRDIERQFSEIGSLVYSAVKEGRDDVLQDEALLTIIERVKVLESELAAKETEIDDIRAAGKAAREAQAAAAPEPPLDAVEVEVDPDDEPDAGPDAGPDAEPNADPDAESEEKTPEGGG